VRLFLMYLAPGRPATTPSEHADIVVPGSGEKTVLQVPVVALERFLPQLAQAAEGLEQRCPDCGEDLATWPPDHARGR
jgi:hypothetical protein